MALTSPRLLEWARMVGATVFVTLLYLLLQNLEFHLMGEAARRGWGTAGVAESLADEARQVAERSAPIEARLDPRHRQLAWTLGMRLGYASEKLGLHGYSDPAAQARARRELAGVLGDAAWLGAALGIGPVAVLPVRTAQEFADLRQRIDRDELGIGAKLEERATPRARHLFLLGMHVGVAMAGLDLNDQVAMEPAGREIARQAVLAGVPEALWRPLAVPPAGGKAAYRQAASALEAWLGPP